MGVECNGNSSADRLVLLQAVWRHGQRAPVGSFKGDLYPKSYWRKGYGELTEKGLQQHFELGQWIRKRYVDELGFLPRTYEPDTFRVRCSVVNRTIESAHENFRGLYGQEKNYRPPVVNTYAGVDCVHLPFRCCANAKKAIAAIQEGPQMQHFVEKYKGCLTKMAAATGKNFATFVDALFLTDPFTTEKHIGLQLPSEWEALFEEIDQAHRDSLRNLYGYTGHESRWSVISIRRALASGLVGEILKNMHGKIEGSPDYKDLKYYVFSAHDTVVLALLSTFGFDKLDYNQDYNVSLGASVFLELWQRPTGEHYVKVLYRRNAELLFDMTADIQGCSRYKDGIPFEFFEERWTPYRFQHGPGICQIKASGSQ